MSDTVRFDPTRSAEIRSMLIGVVRATAKTPLRRRPRRRTLIVLIVAVVVAVAGTGGAAYAIVIAPLIYSPSATPGGQSTLAPVPRWPRNARGQTYGVQGDSPVAPDLIRATTTTGLTGYIYAKDLEAAEGPMPTSPAQASTWNKTHPPHTVYIPVYRNDGTTKIGVFPVGG